MLANGGWTITTSGLLNCQERPPKRLELGGPSTSPQAHTKFKLDLVSLTLSMCRRSLFKGKLVVHSGGVGSGFTNSTEEDTSDEGDVFLYHVKGTRPDNTYGVQVPSRIATKHETEVYGKVYGIEHRQYAAKSSPIKIVLWRASKSPPSLPARDIVSSACVSAPSV